MVYESRVGDVFALGATSLADRGHHPRPGAGLPRARASPGGCRSGRATSSAGRRSWARDRRVHPRAVRAARPTRRARAAGEAGLDEWAAGQPGRLPRRAARGHRTLPDDRTILVERFRDELGDWRLVVHSPYGAQVHAPWALAIGARLRERYGIDAQALPGDDGIVLRIPETDQEPPTAEVVMFEPDEIEEIVTTEVGGSALFAVRFRECAARALLLPAATPAGAQPLWQQRQRSAQLLEVASKYPSFPIVLEAVRECLQDVYDVPALTALMQDVAARRSASSRSPPSSRRRSPGACCSATSPPSCTRATTPIAERRAAALSPRPGPARRAARPAELRELLDPDVLAEVERELQRLADDRTGPRRRGGRRPARLLGPLSDRRGRRALDSATRPLARPSSRTPSVVEVRIAGEHRWAVEDVGRLRDGLGVPCHRARRRCSPSRSPIRSATWWRATPAPTDRSPRRRGRPPRPRGRGGAPDAAPTRRPGPGARGRVPARRDRLGVVRRRGAAAAAPPLAGRAAQGGGAGRAGHLGRFLRPGRTSPLRGAGLRGVDGVVAVEQLAGCAVPPRLWSPWCSGSRSWTTRRRCSTS